MYEQGIKGAPKADPFTISQGYISNELIHFVGRGKDCKSQYQVLLEILRLGCLSNSEENAKKPSGIITELEINGYAKISNNEMYVPQMVCFCDIPIKDLKIHISKYSKFGIAFSKAFIVKNGGMPVHYIPKQAPESGHINKGQFYNDKAEKFMEYWDQSVGNIRDIVIDFKGFLDFNVFSYVKFFDHTLSDSDPKNYYFEREWRILGNLKFNETDVKRVFIQKGFDDDFKKDCPRYNDRICFL